MGFTLFSIYQLNISLWTKLWLYLVYLNLNIFVPLFLLTRETIISCKYSYKTNPGVMIISARTSCFCRRWFVCLSTSSVIWILPSRFPPYNVENNLFSTLVWQTFAVSECLSVSRITQSLVAPEGNSIWSETYCKSCHGTFSNLESHLDPSALGARDTPLIHLLCWVRRSMRIIMSAWQLTL